MLSLCPGINMQDKKPALGKSLALIICFIAWWIYNDLIFFDTSHNITQQACGSWLCLTPWLLAQSNLSHIPLLTTICFPSLDLEKRGFRPVHAELRSRHLVATPESKRTQWACLTAWHSINMRGLCCCCSTGPRWALVPGGILKWRPRLLFPGCCIHACSSLAARDWSKWLWWLCAMDYFHLCCLCPGSNVTGDFWEGCWSTPRIILLPSAWLHVRGQASHHGSAGIC